MLWGEVGQERGRGLGGGEEEEKEELTGMDWFGLGVGVSDRIE